MPTQVVYVFSGVLSRAVNRPFLGTCVARFGNISARQGTPATKQTKWTRSHRPDVRSGAHRKPENLPFLT